MDSLKGLFGGGPVPAELTDMFPDGIPDIKAVQETLAGMSQADVGKTVNKSLAEVDSTKLADFGKMLGDYQTKQGIPEVPGVAKGDAGAISSVLTSSLTGEGGLSGTLDTLQKASGGGGMLDSVMEAVTGGNSELLGLLKNPAIMAILAPILKNLMAK